MGLLTATAEAEVDEESAFSLAAVVADTEGVADGTEKAVVFNIDCGSEPSVMTAPEEDELRVG